jgi:3-phosphoshikimate 1-carboxyvinyltransferase
VKKQTIHPANYLTGGVEPPGDKSISHRYAMLAAIAEGTSELRHFAAAADCHSTLKCMSALGADVKIDKDTVKITGRGAEGLKSSWRALDAGNSGTTIRLLAGILAGQEFTSKLTGDASLQKRPMGRVVSPLRQMGADIRAREDNFPPLEIRAAKLRGIHYQMPMASAQVKSAVLLAITPNWRWKNSASASKSMANRFKFKAGAATAAGRYKRVPWMYPATFPPQSSSLPLRRCFLTRTC